jgi:hypothetical protein
MHPANQATAQSRLARGVVHPVHQAASEDQASRIPTYLVHRFQST